jgi:hypothetical protein
MKDWNVSRRDLLKTLGVGAACLPLLHVERAFGQTAPAARKYLFVVMGGEGYRPMQWLPQVGSFATQTLPDTLSPLESLKSDLLVVPKLTNPNYTGCNNCGHGAYGTIFYGGPATGAEYKEPGLMGPAGFSVDQVVGEALFMQHADLKAKTLPLQLMIDTFTSDGTTGAHRCFWRGAGQPVNPIIDPYAAYSMLVMGSVGMTGTGTGTGMGMTTNPPPNPDAMRILAQKKSILDYVGKDLERFGMRLGTDAQQAIQGHLTSIRDLERTLSGSTGGTGGMGGGGGNPGGGVVNIPIDWTKDIADQNNPACTGANLNGALNCWWLNTANYPDVFDVHMKLGVLALASGVTQVVTLQTVDATGDAKSFQFVPGVQGDPSNTARNGRDLHAISHNPIIGGVDEKQLIDKWFMGQFAKLITLMKGVTQAGGKSLLDNSVVLWGNHMESGDSHLAQSVPWMLAGSAGGYFKTGQCAASAGKPLSGVLASICDAMGVMPNPTFGAPIDGLT